MAIFYTHRQGQPAYLYKHDGKQCVTNAVFKTNLEYLSITYESGLGKRYYETFDGNIEVLPEEVSQQLRLFILGFDEGKSLVHFSNKAGEYMGFLERAVGLEKGYQPCTSAPPTSEHLYSGGKWVLTQKDLRSPLQIATDLVNDWKAMQQDAGVTYKGEVFDSDQSAMVKILALCVAQKAPPNGYWTTKTNKDVPTTLEDMQAIYMEIIRWYAFIHDIQRKMKKSFETMEDEKLLSFNPQEEFLKGTYS